MPDSRWFKSYLEPVLAELKTAGIAEGMTAVEVPGEKVRTVKFKPGDSQWYEGGTKHSLRNIGSALFEAVEIELK